MSPQWMPLYIGDFLADTMHLGATETGIYIRLLMHCWQHGSIPLDDYKLSRIGGCDTRLWHKYRGTVLQFFDPVDASTAQHKRVSSELLRCEEISNKRKAAALQKHSKISANAEQLHTQPQPQPHNKKERDKSLYTRAIALPADWQPDRSFALSKGMTEQRIDEEAERFRNHAAANNRRQANWDSAWKNWVTSPYQQTKPMNGNHASLPRPGSREDREEKTANALAKLRDYARANDAQRGGNPDQQALGLIPPPKAS